MADVKIRFRGIREVQKALKQVSAESAKELKEGFKAIAEDVAADVRAKVPKRRGRAAASVKARGSQRGGAIAVGGSRAPHYPWLDFGGSTGRGHRPGRAWSGAIKRPVVDGGRYLYPTIAEKRDEIIDETDAMLERVIRGAGFKSKER